jgi:hypothetical protein
LTWNPATLAEDIEVRREFQHACNLFPRNVELLHDFLDGGSGFNVFENGGYGHPNIAKTPMRHT